MLKLMRPVEFYRWYLLPPVHAGPRAKPRLSRWKMTAATAAERGALRPEPMTREVRMLAETDEEIRRAGQCQSAGIDGAMGPRDNPNADAGAGAGAST